MGIINEKKKTALLTGIICKSMTINVTRSAILGLVEVRHQQKM